MFLSCTPVVKYKIIGLKIQGMSSISSQCNLTKNSSLRVGFSEILKCFSFLFLVGPCMPSPCQNDGVCSETTNGTSRSFYCECSELYTGQSCDVERIGNKTILDFTLHYTHQYQKRAIMEKTELTFNFCAVNQ